MFASEFTTKFTTGRGAWAIHNPFYCYGYGIPRSAGNKLGRGIGYGNGLGKSMHYGAVTPGTIFWSTHLVNQT